MTSDGGKLHEVAADGLAHLPDRHGAAQPKRSKSLLGSRPPEGATADVLRAWLTTVLALGADPVTGVVRYGRHDDSRLVVTLRSGQRIVYDRQAECFQPDVLVRRVVLVTGARLPAYARGDAFAIAGALVRAADLTDETDDRLEAEEWGATFLEAAVRLDRADTSTPEARYAAFVRLRDWTPNDIAPRAAQRSAVLPTANADGEPTGLLVRVGGFGSHVREMTGRPIAWATLRSRMAEVGWRHLGRVEQRQPVGHARVRLHLYVVRDGWDGRP